MVGAEHLQKLKVGLGKLLVSKQVALWYGEDEAKQHAKALL